MPVLFWLACTASGGEQNLDLYVSADARSQTSTSVCIGKVQPCSAMPTGTCCKLSAKQENDIM